MSPAADAPVLLYMFAGLVLSFGLFLLILGLRGKRIDDHPWCRKCKFDLFGREEASGDQCPECGCDLSKPKVIRIGQRPKRRAVILLGSFVMFFALIGIGTRGYIDATGIDLQQHKPVWLLMREAKGMPGNGTSDAALFELRRRYDAGELNAQEIDTLIETALTHQADTMRPWQPAWGNLIEQARDDGVASDDQWVRYVEGIIENIYILSVRPQVIMGTELVPIKVSRGYARMGDAYTNQDLWLKQGYATTTIGPYSKEVTSTSSGIISTYGNGSSTSYLVMDDNDWATLKPGKYTVTHEFDMSLFEDSSHEGDDSLALVKKRMHLETTIELLPPGKATAKMFGDPDYRRQVEDAIKLQHVRSGQWPHQKGTDTHNLDLSFDIGERLFPISGTTENWTRDNVTASETKLQPIDVAFDIVLVHNGIEYPLASSITNAAVDSTTLATSTRIDANLVGEHVDLILRPSLMRAESSIDCFEIWGEENHLRGCTN